MNFPLTTDQLLAGLNAAEEIRAENDGRTPNRVTMDSTLTVRQLTDFLSDPSGQRWIMERGA